MNPENDEKIKSPGLIASIDGFLWKRGKSSRVAEIVRTCIFSAVKFKSDRGFLRASALTYTTLLSIVPLFALMFSVLKGLGVQSRLEPILLKHFTAGNQDVVNQIIHYIDNTEVGSLGALGLAALLLTAVSVLGNIELSFNDIWQVKNSRTLLRKVSDYIALLVVAPVLLLASISLTTTISSQSFFSEIKMAGAVLPVILKFIPFIAIWIAFTAAYMIMPNRRVPVLSALAGGVTAGTLWHLAEWAYIRFQFGVGKYNAIYGAMAQLPVLLVWIFVSWCIVLFGAELAFFHELPDRGSFLKPRRSLWSPSLDVAVQMLILIGRRFEQGMPPLTEAELESQLGLRVGDARAVLDRLVENGLIIETNGERPGIVPCRAPEKTSVVLLVEKISQLSGSDGISQILKGRLKQALDKEFSNFSWADAAVETEPVE